MPYNATERSRRAEFYESFSSANGALLAGCGMGRCWFCFCVFLVSLKVKAFPSYRCVLTARVALFCFLGMFSYLKGFTKDFLKLLFFFFPGGWAKKCDASQSQELRKEAHEKNKNDVGKNNSTESSLFL